MTIQHILDINNFLGHTYFSFFNISATIGSWLIILGIISLIIFGVLILFDKINKQYLNPEKFKDSVKNYSKIKLSIKEHNYLLGINNKIHWYDLITHTYSYYISDTEFIMYKYLTIFTKIFTIFIFPERENPSPKGKGLRAINLDSQYTV
jgi:hypothetical protein